MTDINLKDLYEMFYEDPDFSGGLGGNPNGSKKDAAWDEAQTRYKQHKNNEKALKVGVNQDKADEAKALRSKKRSPLHKLLGKEKNTFSISEAIKEKKMKKQYDDLEESYDNKPVRRSDQDSQRGDVGHDTRRKKDTDKSRRGIKKGPDDYEELEESWEKKPRHRGPWREAGSSTGRKKEADREKGRGYGSDGYPRWKRDLSKEDDHTDKLNATFPNVDEFDVTNEDAVEHKEKKNMAAESMVVNSILKDLASKGIIKSQYVQKEEMSIPAIAGLVGAGAMLAKIFKLEDDDDDETIAKQVTDFMGENQDFFDGVGKLCEHICSLHEGEESGDESRGQRLIESASAFHKACSVPQDSPW